MMDFFKKIVEKILRALSINLLKKHDPFIVGVSGSIGKTSTKEAIYTVLKKEFYTRESDKNYNNELGVPLTILGLGTVGRSFLLWVGVFFKAILKILFEKKYPKILVLELGVDRPKDMDFLMSFVSPRIGVVTSVGPTHLEFFRSVKDIADEKAKLIEALSYNGIAILNFDDEKVRDMRDKTEAKVMTYGLKEGADVRGILTESSLSFDADRWLNMAQRDRFATVFKVGYQGTVVPVRLKSVGAPHIYAVLAAIVTGLAMDINLVQITKSLLDYEPPHGRMNLIEGIKKTLIIDDTYNSAPDSAIAAVSYLDKIQTSGRKIAIMGDMLELGIYTEDGHRKVGRALVKFVDILVTVGEKSKFMAEEARGEGLADVYEFDTNEKVGDFIQKKLNKFDVVLVKASQGIRLEKVVKEIMAEPLKAESMLVRQDEKWERV
ncbi:MAG: hypothetical protein ACD_63C00125G0008 [uncultured bacterium]|nr:MAG: hypothetical protein ACD_63C00125G0008 [uncultured bacterium]